MEPVRWLALGVALAQGLLLFALHRSVEESLWPATDLRLLAPLWLLTAFIPPSLQVLWEHLRSAPIRTVVAVLAGVLIFFGWHYGAHVDAPNGRQVLDEDLVFSHLAPLVIAWLIAMPFLLARLDAGTWRFGYPRLFQTAWRLKLIYLQAGLFVGVFWLLLGLWGVLFSTLGIRWFAEVFTSSAFAYPATTLAASLALQLVSRSVRLLDVVHTQALNLLKWLAPLAGLMVVAFSVVLVSKLPALVFHGERAIGAHWLLWLVAVNVLLLNAVYQDGQSATTAPPLLRQALRVVPPLLVIVALTALYALVVRTQEFGLTLSRFWGLVVAALAAAYSLGYSWGALRPGPWFTVLGRTNIVLALSLMGIIALALSPLGAPHRWSAQSQADVARRSDNDDQRRSALVYLRFSAGAYGAVALQSLHADAGARKDDGLQAAIDRVREQKNRWQAVAEKPNFIGWRRNLTIIPSGRAPPAELEKALERLFLQDDLQAVATMPATAVWADVRGLGQQEFVLVLGPGRYRVLAEQGSEWAVVSQGTMQDDGKLTTDPAR